MSKINTLEEKIKFVLNSNRDYYIRINNGKFVLVYGLPSNNGEINLIKGNTLEELYDNYINRV